jgi:hypothetical protein
MTENKLDISIPSDMKQISIETMDGTLEFHGKLLGVVDNERRGRPRWAEIELYKYIDTDPAHISLNPDLNTYGQQLYLLHTMGHSVVYHTPSGNCNRGILVPVKEIQDRAEFPHDLEPCEECNPLRWEYSPEDSTVEVEVLRHLVYKCRTAEDVLAKLRRPPRGGVPGAPVLSSPGQRLVELVKYKDDDIRLAAQRIVRL